LIRITEVLKSFAPLAQHGADPIALGEAWSAVEDILEGRSVDVNVGLEVGIRRGDSEFKEGLFLGFRINDEAIILDELNTTYSSDVSSDHYTYVYASRERSGGLDGIRVETWIAKLEEVKRFDDVQLSTHRDHL
jgi:hypothetical protein